MKKFFKEWKFTILGGFLILILGLALRLYNLTQLPVFVDEAIYVRWAQVMRAEPTLRFLPLSDGKQPLFMWLIIPFLKVFADPLFAGRFTSIISGTGTLLGIFFLSNYLFKSKKIALVASLFYALSPFSVFFDRMALVDSLLTMFGVWTFFLGLLAAKTLRLDFAMLAGFSLGGGLLTKSPAVFYVLLLPLTWFFSRGRHLLKLFFLFGVSLLIGYAMYNILRLGPNFNMIAFRNGDYLYAYSHILKQPLDPLLGHLEGILSYFIMLAPFGLLLLAVVGFLTNISIKNNSKKVLVILMWAVLPILAVAEYSKGVTARYILFTLPFIAILAASSILTKSGLMRKVILIGFMVFVGQSIFTNWKFLTDIERAPLPQGERSGYLEEWTAGTGIAEVGEFLIDENSQNPGKTMVVGTEGYFGTLPDGLQIYLNDYPNIIVIGVGIPIASVNNSLIESKKAGNKTYLVVNSTRFAGNSEKLGLTLIAAYPKAFRKVGSREYNLYGPQEVLYLFEVSQRAIFPSEQ